MHFIKCFCSRPMVAERSKASVLRSWMRKVVGSNPGEGNRLSFVVSKDRMKGSNGRIECDLRSAIFRGTRGRSNQPSSSVAPSTSIVNININVCEDEKYRS